MALARIGLGSNEGDPATYVEAAFVALARYGHVTARSSLYATKAWGVTDQPDFVNAAALLETELAPRDLLAALKTLESELGRVSTFRWGPRAIDLDILAYDDLVLREVDLVIPHERLHERAFALAPLAEIDASFEPLFGALSVSERAAVQRIPVVAARIYRVVTWDETLDRLRSAAEFCASAGLVRVRIEEDNLTIDVRRTARAVTVPLVTSPEAEPGAPTLGALAATNGNSHAAQAANVLRAEFVGIVRLSRPTVAVGAEIAEDRELAYVESLGIRNPIRSGGPGRVAEVFVTDGEAVEYGQPLFSIEK